MKGGYQRDSRLVTLIEEIHMEANVARRSTSRSRRDRSFAEIERLARQAAQLAGA